MSICNDETGVQNVHGQLSGIALYPGFRARVAWDPYFMSYSREIKHKICQHNDHPSHAAFALLNARPTHCAQSKSLVLVDSVAGKLSQLSLNSRFRIASRMMDDQRSSSFQRTKLT